MSRPVRKYIGRVFDPRTGTVSEDVTAPNYLTREERTRIRKDKSDMYVQTATGRFPVTYVQDVPGTYGKAKIYTDGSSTYLRSYDTIVCALTQDSPQDCYDYGWDTRWYFTRYWADWSRTTNSHIDAFLQAHNLGTISKREWLKLPLNTPFIYTQEA